MLAMASYWTLVIVIVVLVLGVFAYRKMGPS
jgi:hypothetical protein